MKKLLIIILYLGINPIYAQTTSLDSKDSLTYEQIQQQAEQIDMSGWQVFSDNVKSCTPSVLDLPNPLQIKAFITTAANMKDVTQNINQTPAAFTQETFDRMLAAASIHVEILGWLDKNCQVTMSMTTGPIDRIPDSNRTIIKNCLIPKDSVPFIVDNINRMTSGSVSNNFLGSDPLNAIVSSFCR